MKTRKEIEKWIPQFVNALKTQEIDKNAVDKFSSYLKEIMEKQQNNAEEQQTKNLLNTEIPKIVKIVVATKPYNSSLYLIYGKILECIVSLIPCLLQTENIGFFDAMLSLFQDKYQPFFLSSVDNDRYRTSKYYLQIIDAVIRNNFKECIAKYLYNTKIFNFRRVGIICFIALSIKKVKTVEFDFSKEEKDIVNAISVYSQKLTKEEIREINEKEASWTFDLLRLLSTTIDERGRVNVQQILFETLLVKTNFLAQKYAALNSIHKLIQTNERNTRQICSILQDVGFLKAAEENMHISLLQDVSCIVREMDSFGFDCSNSIKNIWIFSSQATNSSQQDILTAWKLMMSTATALFIESFIDVICNNFDTNCCYLLSYISSISWRFNPNQKTRIFNALDSFYFSQETSKPEIINALVSFSPNDSSILQKCIDLLNEGKNTSYALALLRGSLKSADDKKALDVLHAMIQMNPTNPPVYIDTLCTVLMGINLTISENDYCDVLDALEPFAEKEQATIISCLSKLQNQSNLSTKVLKKMFDIACAGERVNSVKLNVIKAIYAKLKTTNIIGIGDPLWNLLFRSGSASIATIVVDHFIPGKANEFIAKCLQHIDSVGALIGLKILIHLTEDGVDRALYGLEERNYDQGTYVNVFLTGQIIEKALIVPLNISLKAFKLRISEYTQIDANSLSLSSNGRILSSDNFNLTNEMQIVVNVSRNFQELEAVKDLPSKTLVNAPYSLRLLEILKENSELSNYALQVLYLIPTIESEKQLVEDENVDWSSFLDTTNTSLFLYRINIIQQQIDRNKTSLYVNGGINKLLCVIPTIIKDIGKEHDAYHVFSIILKAVESELFLSNASDILSTLTIENKKEIIKAAEDCLKDGLPIREMMITLIMKLIKQSSTFNETNEVQNIVSLAIFDSSRTVRAIAKEMLSLFDTEEKNAVIAPLLSLSATQNCKEFFDVLYEISNKNPNIEMFNTIFNVLKEKCKLPDDQCQQLRFTTPPQAFIFFIFNSIYSIISKLEDVPNHLEFFTFIVDNILFCRTKYYDPSKPLLDTVLFLCSKYEDVQQCMIEKLKSVHEACFKNNLSNEVQFSVLRFKGLKNMGATCYMNATLQQLYHIPEFRNLFLSLDLEKDWQVALQKLFAMLEFSPYCYMNTHDFVKTWPTDIGEPVNPHEQQDACEFLQLLLTRLCDDVDKRFKDLFEGEMTHTIVGTSTLYHSKTTESFFTLTLDVKGHQCLEEGLKSLLEPDVFEGDNGYNCGGEIGRIDAERRHIVTKAPPYLIMQLKRFEYNLETLTREKINSRFTFPVEIDISPITENVDETLYELIGVEVHSGTSQSGHYFSHHDTEDGWLTFNDTSVARCTRDKMIDYCAGGFDFIEGQNTPVERQSNAYILFYKRKGFDGTEKYEMSEKILNELVSELQSVLLRNSIQQPQISDIIMNLKESENSVQLIFNHLVCLLHGSPIHQSVYFVDKVISFIERSKEMATLVLKLINEALDLTLVSGNRETRQSYSSIIVESMKKDKEEAIEFIKKMLEKVDDFSIIEYWNNFDEFFIPFLHVKLKETDVPRFLNLLIAVIPQHALQHPTENVLQRIRCSKIFNILSSIQLSDDSKKKYAAELLSLKFINTWADGPSANGFIKFISKIIKGEPANSELLLKNIRNAKPSTQVLSSLFLVGIEAGDDSLLAFVKSKLIEYHHHLDAFFRYSAEKLPEINTEYLIHVFDDWITYGILSPIQDVRESCRSFTMSAFPVAFKYNEHKTNEERRKGSKVFEKLMSCILSATKSVREEGNNTLNEYFFLLESVAVDCKLIGEVIHSCDIFISALHQELTTESDRSAAIATNFFKYIYRSITPTYSKLLFGLVDVNSFLSILAFMNTNENVMMQLIDFIPVDFVAELCRSNIFSVSIDASTFTSQLSAMIFGIATVNPIAVAAAFFTPDHISTNFMVQKLSYFHLCGKLMKMFNETSNVFFDSNSFSTLGYQRLNPDEIGSEVLKTLARFNEAYFTFNRGKTSFFGFPKTSKAQNQLELMFSNLSISSLKPTLRYLPGKIAFIRSFAFVGGKMFALVLNQLKKCDTSLVENLPVSRHKSFAKVIVAFCERADDDSKAEILTRFISLKLSEAAVFILASFGLEMKTGLTPQLASSICRITKYNKRLLTRKLIKALKVSGEAEDVDNVVKNAVFIVENSDDCQLVGSVCSLLCGIKHEMNVSIPVISRESTKIISFFESQESEAGNILAENVREVFAK